jgi:hypothetical protein
MDQARPAFRAMLEDTSFRQGGAENATLGPTF